ncbi:hypothetical protein CCACVL1_20541 [Corchorus capsularis]|uniref:Uncharacterized protein n=1 Tax=Corchorus capsularis TaxID=210143 RepID=A0A1R3HAQ0_COCAP|nr:hypothetical protein CCACVL1_20541 [Corchorus capsularis]
MGGRIMRLLALALAISIMVSSCLAGNRKVIKAEVLSHEDTTVHGRQLVGDGGGNGRDGYPSSSVSNHHYIPRQDFNNYPGGGGDGSG